jgi:molecular chaperone DnaJ
LQAKDYYKILELSPTATLKEIKAAYRRLAHQYHPDKNNNDMYAAAKFEIIKEAYEVLSHPSKKEYYLQQRWYDQSMAKKQSTDAITPVSVLKRLLEFDKYVSTLDVHRMDKEGLFAYINDILSDETIKKLNTFNETDINNVIIDTVIKSSRPLSYSYIKQLSASLKKIKADESGETSIDRYLSHSLRSAEWNKYRIWLIIVIVILLCLFIYYFSR